MLESIRYSLVSQIVTKELAGIDEANRKKVVKRNLVEAMHDTAMVEEWELDDIVKATPLRFMDWYLGHGYKIEWTGDDDGPVFPTDGTMNVLTRHLNKILERDWKIDFGTLCDHCHNEIMTIMVKMGFRIQGFKNGKYTTISALAPAVEAYELGNGISLSDFICRSLPTSLLLRVGIMEGVCPVGIASRFSHTSEIFCQVEHIGERLGCSFLDTGADSWFILSYP